MPMRRAMLILSVAIGLPVAPMVLSQKAGRAELRFQEAHRKETIDGDLKAAIDLYRRAIDEAGGNRAIAAQALVRMGQCYEKLGDAEARKAYERVVRDFGDQKDLAETARTRLAALGGDAPVGQKATRLVWAGPNLDASESSVSPDGRFISFPDWDTGNLALHDLATGADRQLTNTGTWKRGEGAFAQVSAISRDGQQVAYAWYTDKLDRYELRVVGVNGDPKPRRLFEKPDVEDLAPCDWSPDGKWILATLQSKDFSQQIVLIGAQDGSLRVLKSISSAELVDRGQYPEGRFSPDGKYFVYTLRVKGGASRGYILSADGKEEVPLISGTSSARYPVWAPDGSRIVFTSNRGGSLGLWSVRVADGKPLGDPELVNGDYSGDIYPMSFSRDGSLFYGVYRFQSDIHLAGLDPATGKLTSEPRRVNERSVGQSRGRLSWLPDGRSLSFYSRQSPSDALVVHTLSTREERVIWGGDSTRPIFGGGYWGWFADGKNLMAFTVEGQNEVFRRVDITTGQVQASWTVPKLKLPANPSVRAFSPDMMTMYYVQKDQLVCKDPQCANVILARDLETGRDREVLRTYGKNLNLPSISHDGRELAFIAESDTKVLMVAPTAGGPPRDIHRFSEGFPRNMPTAWTLDGGHVLVFRRAASYHGHVNGGEVWSISTKGGSPERSPLPMQFFGQPAVSPDGTQVAFVVGNDKEEIWIMTGLFRDAKPAPKR